MWEPPYHDVEPPPGDGPLVLVAPSTAQDPRPRAAPAALAGLGRGAGAACWRRPTASRCREPVPVPANTRLVEWISYSRTMPGCALVICHAGHGTMARALACGGARRWRCPTLGTWARTPRGPTGRGSACGCRGGCSRPDAAAGGRGERWRAARSRRGRGSSRRGRRRQRRCRRGRRELVEEPGALRPLSAACRSANADARLRLVACAPRPSAPRCSVHSSTTAMRRRRSRPPASWRRVAPSASSSSTVTAARSALTGWLRGSRVAGCAPARGLPSPTPRSRREPWITAPSSCTSTGTQ